MQNPECPRQNWHGKTNLRPVCVSSLLLTVSKSLNALIPPFFYRLCQETCRYLQLQYFMCRTDMLTTCLFIC